MSDHKKLHQHAPDPQGYGAQVNLADEMTYGRHLMLDQLLSAQQPLSTDHNEWLFIIQHQTTELWLKLALIELRAACAAIAADQLPIAFKTLARVARIMEHLVHAWGVLVTMTPSEFSAIRPHLGSGSGFQSWQYREIEFVLGNKNAATLKAHAHRADLHAQLEAALAAPSLYDEAIRLLARRGLPIAAPVLVRDVRRPHEFDPSVERAWFVVYKAPEQRFDLYELAEELVDLEDAFRQWRFRHVTTVDRVIGFKPC